MRRILLIPFFASCFTPRLMSQERLTLQDAIARSLEKNFDIRIAAVTTQQAAANNTPGNAGLLPDINGNAGINSGLSNTHIEFADGRVQEVSNAGTVSYSASVTASYTFFAAGRAWLVKKQLAANEELAQTLLREQVQRSISGTIQAYAKAVWQEQQQIAIDTGLALAKARMILSQIKFETGASAKVDYLQARVDYNTRQADSLRQYALIQAAFADLNLLMGEDPYKIYILDDSLGLNLSLHPLLKENLGQVNMSIQAAKKTADLSALQSRITRSYLFPSASANAGYSWNKSQSQSGTFLFNRNYGPTGGLNLNVPVFQGGNLRRQAKVASLESFKDELAYERQNTEVGRQYKTAWKDYEASVAAYKLELENIQYAKENLDIQKARFRVGIATTLETREAENGYVQALIRLYTAAYNTKVNETRVLELQSAVTE